jgi:hypothetical protein
MDRPRPLPRQKPPLPADPATAVISSLHTWPDAELTELVRAAACELMARDHPLPAAVPIVEALAAIPAAFSPQI